MKIAQVAPLWENIPPAGYGGTELVVHLLTEGLVAKGHEVTLFACGTSKTQANLTAVYPRPLIEDGISWNNLMYPLLNITEALDRAEEFDIIHMHLNKASDYLALPLSKPFKNKVIFTFHFVSPSLKHLTDRQQVLEKYNDLNYVAISNAQKKGMDNLNFISTIYHGLDLASYSFYPKPHDYVIWLGKFNPDKGTKEAIHAAKKAGIKLIIAGKIDSLEGEDLAYYNEEIRHYLDDPQIQFVEEVTIAQKNKLFGEAKAFLNPIQWNEPFGLVMIEAMASGTPVISFRNGAAPEIIADGTTGFLVDTVDQMVEKIGDIDQIDRSECRKRVETLFSAPLMVENYIKIYEKLGIKS